MPKLGLGGPTTTGATGASGPTGATGAVPSAYGYVFNTGAQTVTPSAWRVIGWTKS
jgi:hypothetical protein